MARILVEILNILLLLLRDSMIIKIYVSSTNSLVDMEIKRYGFTPVRFGSEKYIKTFRKCKYVLSMVTRGIKCTSLQIRYLFKHGTVFH